MGPVVEPGGPGLGPVALCRLRIESCFNIMVPVYAIKSATGDTM